MHGNRHVVLFVHLIGKYFNVHGARCGVRCCVVHIITGTGGAPPQHVPGSNAPCPETRPSSRPESTPPGQKHPCTAQILAWQMSDRLLKLHKGKWTRHTGGIRKRHKASLQLESDRCRCLQENAVYTVQGTKDKVYCTQWGKPTCCHMSTERPLYTAVTVTFVSMLFFMLMHWQCLA